jgi:hypothetical protein
LASFISLTNPQRIFLFPKAQRNKPSRPLSGNTLSLL